MVSITKGTLCDYPLGCSALAISVIYSRKYKLLLCCCPIHVEIVGDEQAPNEVVECPNCQCLIPFG